MVAREPHKLKAGGSTPPPATKPNVAQSVRARILMFLDKEIYSKFSIGLINPGSVVRVHPLGLNNRIRRCVPLF